MKKLADKLMKYQVVHSGELGILTLVYIKKPTMKKRLRTKRKLPGEVQGEGLKTSD